MGGGPPSRAQSRARLAFCRVLDVAHRRVDDVDAGARGDGVPRAENPRRPCILARQRRGGGQRHERIEERYLVCRSPMRMRFSRTSSSWRARRSRPSLPDAGMPAKVRDGEDHLALGLHDEECAEGKLVENPRRTSRKTTRKREGPSSIRESVARSSPRNSVPRPARSRSYQEAASSASISASGRTTRPDIYRPVRRRSSTLLMTSLHGRASPGAL
jgi:hypothetical protein